MIARELNVIAVAAAKRAAEFDEPRERYSKTNMIDQLISKEKTIGRY